jgi:hypothetical protein
MRSVERKKTGRPPKGDRTGVSLLLPTAFKAAAKEHAAQRGMTFTDLVGELLAKEIGLPYQTQEGLPLNKAS